jgi:2-dehydrotetronate isomerase
MPRFAANLGFLWPDRPLLERVGAAARAGFQAVELHFPYDVPALDLKIECERHGVTLLGINTAAGDVSQGEFGLGAVPGRERDFQGAVDQAIRYCLQSGARAIHCMAGNVSPWDHARAKDVLIDNLSRALDEATPHGLTLLLEPLNPRDHPRYFYSQLSDAAELIDHLNSVHLKLQFDVYHVAIAEGDVLTKLQTYLPIIGNVQIAAVPSRAEPDEGEIAYPRIFSALDALRYAGWVGCEYRPRADTDTGLRWMQSLDLNSISHR